MTGRRRGPDRDVVAAVGWALVIFACAAAWGMWLWWSYPAG